MRRFIAALLFLVALPALADTNISGTYADGSIIEVSTYDFPYTVGAKPNGTSCYMEGTGSNAPRTAGVTVWGGNWNGGAASTSAHSEGWYTPASAFRLTSVGGTCVINIRGIK